MKPDLENLAAHAAPAVFVVLRSTGFVATKYVLRDADPLTYLAIRMTLVVGLMAVIAAIAMAAMAGRIRRRPQCGCGYPRAPVRRAAGYDRHRWNGRLRRRGLSGQPARLSHGARGRDQMPLAILPRRLRGSFRSLRPKTRVKRLCAQEEALRPRGFALKKLNAYSATGRCRFCETEYAPMISARAATSWPSFSSWRPFWATFSPCISSQPSWPWLSWPSSASPSLRLSWPPF
jgi:hypothetical protein